MRVLTRAKERNGFTLVELLVVIAIVAVLMSVLLPALSRARQESKRAVCLSNLRQLQIAQVAYAGDHADALIAAGDGTEQGAWLGPLERYGASAGARRCPLDASRHFSQPTADTPPRLRKTSYGLNNYVSPTHAPFGRPPLRLTAQVSNPGRVISLAELAETGAYATADHIHPQDFFSVLAPQITIGLIDLQLPLGRHGGRPQTWDATLNFSFVDGHAESEAMRRVYVDPTENLFDPVAAR